MKRLVLFDIDGTLVSGGPAKEAFGIALIDAFGTTGPIEVHDFSGKTDPQIARELLTESGLADEEVEAGLDRLWDRYLEELEARLQERPMRVLLRLRAERRVLQKKISRETTTRFERDDLKALVRALDQRQAKLKKRIRWCMKRDWEQGRKGIRKHPPVESSTHISA